MPVWMDWGGVSGMGWVLGEAILTSFPRRSIPPTTAIVELLMATVTCSWRGEGREVRFTHLEGWCWFGDGMAVTAADRRVEPQRNCWKCMVETCRERSTWDD